MTDDELTPSEREALAALPREPAPSPHLEERVVRALRSRGVLKERERWTLELSPLRVAAALATCIALLVGGFMLGRSSSATITMPVSIPEGMPGATSYAVSLQGAGTAYLRALEDLASSSHAASGEDRRQACEVALVTLYAATRQIAAIAPKDYMAREMLRAIETSEPAAARQQAEGSAPQQVWF